MKTQERFVKMLFKIAIDNINAANGHIPIVSDKPNVGCVKLAKSHRDLPATILRRCNLRNKEFRESGVSEATMVELMRKDLYFLSYLKTKLAAIGTNQENCDMWLFFDNSIEDTPYFDLRESSKGAKVTYSSYVIDVNF